MKPSFSSPIRPVAAPAVAAAALTAVVFLQPAVASQAAVAAPSCPSSVGAVGFPIDFTPLASAEATVSITAGALPAGVSLSNRGEAPHLVGDPTTVQTASFTLSATSGSGTTESIPCTIDVRKAPVVQNIAGTDRYDQAVAVSKLEFTSAKTVYIASGAKYPDALSAGSLAAHHEAPLLLTRADTIPDAVLDEIARLAPDDVVIVGGEASVSKAVHDRIDSRTTATITRIGGADRYAVSRALVSHPEFGYGTGGSEQAFVVTGRTFPDALTSTPAAAAAGSPVLLVDGTATSLDPADLAVLDFLGVADVVIAGGTASVSAAMEASISESFDTVRLAGVDRYQAGVAVNKGIFAAAPDLYLASGTAFADALSGGVVAGIEKSPLYVTTPGCLTNEVYFEIGRLAPTTVYTLGGPATLGAGVTSLTPCGLD
ncbi:cell wall-binding repeat-containing protein [Herbiconiux sp. CPCC 203407]|uniref:Cell wall-binding repeat-containing protein n=1 Tax=Herbiconiux oxytropis TaxID=2970915 RepID=A0AA42BUC4_9MICO|nr:cell wall-binding repeat-containing protein [Herbiconiux oxytropis]MCS5721616.1 cell wall-binding repeat-containing protein [Herbiconiux oxytropis]MCS5726757.1 cell wall-binding repeat-containing protein [Herbiconiux oxytropis]